MNMITADFNWFSFLIVIIGAVIGIVKSNKKRVEPSGPLESVFTFDEEDESGNSVNVCKETEEAKAAGIWENPDSNQWESVLETTNDNPGIATITENEEEEQDIEEKRQFDIRQAIISSEILNRPHF